MSKSRAKGTSYESSLLPALRTVWPTAERRALQGAKDKGDFSAVGGWVLEAKNCAKLDLAGWLKEAAKEATNAETSWYAVIHKRRGTTDPRQQYVLMNLGTLLAVLEDYEDRAMG
jgi:hypothetical protein